MLIVICERRRRGRDGWQVNLTDGARVYRRRFHRSATVALIRVRRLLRQGDAVVAPGALRDLMVEVAAELTDRPAATD